MAHASRNPAPGIGGPYQPSRARIIEDDGATGLLIYGQLAGASAYRDDPSNGPGRIVEHTNARRIIESACSIGKTRIHDDDLPAPVGNGRHV